MQFPSFFKQIPASAKKFYTVSFYKTLMFQKSRRHFYPKTPCFPQKYPATPFQQVKPTRDQPKGILAE